MSDEGVRPFHCGSQYAEWTDRNCASCKLSRQEGQVRYRCQLEKALDLAYWGDGKVPLDVANAIGMHAGKNYWSWECPAKQVAQPRERKPPKTREHPGQMRLV